MKQKSRIFNTLFTFVASLFLLSACGDSAALTENTQDIEKIITDKFGQDLHFTEFRISNGKGPRGKVVSSMGMTLTTDPSSLEAESWNYSDGNWEQISEVTLEMSGDAKPEDFMLSLDELALPKLQEMINHAKTHLTKEKNIENPFVTSLSISTPNRAPKNESQFLIFLQPENGGTSFNLSYTLEGEFKEMDY
ncbi:MAG: hypothetical protein ACFB0B_08870 [Thermonemataceae bacterium]